MAVEIRADVNSGGTLPAPPERVYHFTCLGNFSGTQEPRTQWKPLAVNRNSWNSLFEELQPRLQFHVALPGINDLKPSLTFQSLKDFSEKGLIARIPFLEALKAFTTAAGSASKEKPFPAKAFCQERPALAPLVELAAKHGEEQVIDLLAMVDIGEETDSGLHLPNLGACLKGALYEGGNRSALNTELVNVRNMVLDQITGDPKFLALHGQWRALKHFLPCPGIQLTLIDCRKAELCDATFLTFIKPDRDEPAPLDLAFYCHEFGLGEADHHILFHLGRMAESLAAPFLLNAAPKVLGCKTWGHLSHVRDFSGRLAGPGHVKWRKLRDESGSHWLFMALNPFRLDLEEDHDNPNALLSAPASFYPALLMANQVSEGKWPADLLHPGHQSTHFSRCLARLDDEQGYELSFEGFCALTGKENGDRLYLLGMMGFGFIKMSARDKLEAANLVEHTLSYRFYCGSCSRFLAAREHHPNLHHDLKTFAGVTQDEDFRFEEADGQSIFRIKAPFQIFGVKPDLILALS